MSFSGKNMDFDASNSKMKKSSPIYPGYDGGDYGFDPQLDFSQFLEEARKHASKENFQVGPQYQEDQKRQLDEAQKSKKSWKKFIFSWWKTDKKSNFTVEPQTSFQISQPKCGRISSSSGLIYGSGVGGGASCKPRRPTSGPLTSLFQPAKTVENEIPYMCLDKLDDPHGVQSYGPVYLVT